MKKNDYRAEFEENRQKIDLNEEKVQSRAELHRKKARKPKKSSTHRLINVLLALFTLIPIGILAFVISSWYTPGEDYSAKVDDSKFQVETRENKPEAKPKENDLDKESEEERLKKEETAKKEQEEKVKAEKAKQEAEEAERLEKEQAEKAEEERIKQEQAKKAEEERIKQAEAKKETEKPAAKSHTVKAGETLYRISVTYYGNGDGVSKIQAANGLASNEISVGQTLTIP